MKTNQLYFGYYVIALNRDKRRSRCSREWIICDTLCSSDVRGLRGRVVNASRFVTTRPSPLWFWYEPHERHNVVVNCKRKVTGSLTGTMCSFSFGN